MTTPTRTDGPDREDASADVDPDQSTKRGRRHQSKSSAIVALAGAELRRLARDRIALLFIIVMPVLVIVIVGATIGAGARHVPIGILDEDQSTASHELIDQLRSSGKVDPTSYSTRTELQRDIRTSRQTAGLVVPGGFGAAASSGVPASVLIDAVQLQDAQTVQPIVQSALDTLGIRRAATSFVAGVDHVDPGTAAGAVDSTASGLAEVPVHTRTIGTPQLESDNQFSYAAPSNLVLFMFITSVAGGGALVETRRLGVARRMLAAPVGTGTVIAGFGIVRLLIALVQAMLIIVVGAVAFGVSWGQPAGVVALVFAYAVMAVGAGLTVGAIARNAEQAAAIGVPVGIALGMLGGCMWPLDIVPAGLRAVGHLTPQAWAMDGFIGLIFDSKGIGDIAGTLAVLLAYAIGLLTLGLLLLRRTLMREG